MHDVELIAEERTILMGYKRAAPYVLMKAKSEALLLLDRNVKIEVVAEFVNRAASTITGWVRPWHHAGSEVDVLALESEQLARAKAAADREDH